MSWWNTIKKPYVKAYDYSRKALGEGFHNLGSSYKLPEFGISEFLTKGLPRAKAVTPADYNNQQTGGGSSWGETTQQPTTPTDPGVFAGTDTGYSTGGGTTTQTPVFQPQIYKGAWYTDPASLMQAQQSDIETSFADKMKYLEETYKEGIAALGQQRKQAREDLETNLKKQLFGLQGYYSAIAPDAYQSSQMVNEQGLKDETAQQQERSQSALDRALSSAGRDYTMNKQALGDWRTGAMSDVANAAYDFTRTQPASISQPSVNYQNPVYDWGTAEALGKINVFGRSVDQGSAQGKASTGNNTYLGQATNQDKKKSALSKYLYA